MSAAKAPTWAQLRKQLMPREPAELIDLIKQLYELNNDNKLFLTSHLMEMDVETLAAPYRKAIQQVFNPTRGFPSLELRAGRKALNDFKRACRDVSAVADLMIFYVEQGVICTRTYGDIHEQFYLSLESVYAEAIKVIVNSAEPDLVEKFRPRLGQILYDTHGMGWGFHDTLSDLYYNSYPREGEE